MKTLSKIRGFIPYIIIVFLNAFIDLGHKIVIQNTIFKMWDGQTQVILTAIINALILLPFILLFSPSGFLSDRFSKHKIIQYGALVAVVATLCITVSYYMGWFWMAFGLTLLLAIQSAIYSPAKYGYLRELVSDEQLAQSNATVQTVTIIAILLGTFVFSAFFELFIPATYTSTSEILQSIVILGWVLVGLSVIEWLTSLSLKEKYAGDATKSFTLTHFASGTYLKKNIKAIRSHETIWLSIVGLSIFWAISQVVLASFPAYAKASLSIDNTVLIQGLLACTGIGIMLGSIIAGKTSRSYIEIGLIPLSALGIALTLSLLPTLEGKGSLALAFILLGTFGGLFIVPLNALIQYTAKSDQIGTILAGNNWVQNITMLSFLALTVVFSLAGFNSVSLFYMLAFVALCGACYTVKKLPHSLARIIASGLLKRKYRIDVVGFHNLPKHGGVLLLGNHISWIDWAIVQIACPRPVRFVMIRNIYNVWYLKPIFKFFGTIPISRGNSSQSLATVNEYLKNGEVVCLFPEGTISRNGHLSEFKTGYERAVEDVKGLIVPFYLRGLWGSLLSRSKSEKLRGNTANGLKRDIIVAFGEALPMDTKADTLKQKVFELSIDAWDKHTDTLDPVPLSWIKTCKKKMGNISLIDSSGREFTNAETLTATLVFAKHIRKLSPEKNIGVMLPASSAGIMTNMAVMLNGQTAVNLNYTTGIDALLSAMDNAAIHTIYTSSKFVEQLKQRGIDTDPIFSGKQVVFLETLKDNMTRISMLRHWVLSYVLPAPLIYRFFGKTVDIESAAQILFSSGSEGCPKGVVLSHRNIMSNIKQISDVLNTQKNDVVMAALPPFHSFGLTVTSIMPMVEGIPAICHPDPRDVLNIAKAVAKYQVSIMFGTATFLRLYARNKKVLPLMLDSLRVVVAGAEKLSNDVREAFELKFKKDIFEGYGATETTPVASVNIPDRLDTSTWKLQVGQKSGSVGLPLPGTSFRIVDANTMAPCAVGEEGLVLISGNQVMKGYLNDPERTSNVFVEIEGRRWYKTGDKGQLDKDGFLTIIDRYSRFAKIGGEMISLTAVENTIRQILDDDLFELAAVNIDDAQKGERIVLLIQDTSVVATLRPRLIESGMPAIMIPSQVYAVGTIPKLGSGKTDFHSAKHLAASLV